MKEKNHNTFFPAFRLHGNGGHLGLYGTSHGIYNFKTASSNAVNSSCTHVEDIYNLKKRRPTRVV